MGPIALLAGIVSGLVLGDPPPLSGPSVGDHPERTLGDRSYDGSMRALGAPAPEAALDLLELSGGESERVAAILGERAAVIDNALARNFDGLQLFPAAEAEGNRIAQIAIVWNLLASLEPLRERPPLEKELRAALEPSNQGAYDEILDRYRSELIARSRAEAERTGTEFDGLGLALEAWGKTLEVEIERAFERRISDGSMWLETIIDKLDLTDEQERQVRGMSLDYFEEVGLDPTQEEQERFFLKLLTHLRPDQAAKLIKIANDL